MYCVLKGKEGEKMMVKKSNMNTLITRMFVAPGFIPILEQILVINAKGVLPLHRI